MYSEIVREPQFYLDFDGNFFPEATTFIMTGNNLVFLCKMLSSDVLSYAFKRFYAGGGLGGDGYRYKKEFLKNLPVPLLDKNDYCHSIENAKPADIEQLCKHIYSLSSEELGFIQNRLHDI